MNYRELQGHKGLWPPENPKKNDAMSTRNAKGQIEFLVNNLYCSDPEEAHKIIKSSLDALSDIPSRRAYPGETIYDQTESANKIIFIEKGLAFTYLENANGVRHVGELISGITITGSESAVSQKQRTNTLVSINECGYKAIETSVLAGKLRKAPDLGLFIFASQSVRHQKRDERMMRLITFSRSIQRVAYTLLELSSYKNELSESYLNQQQIAELACCSREEASRALNRLRRQNIIAYSNYFGNTPFIPEILRPEELTDLIDEI